VGTLVLQIINFTLASVGFYLLHRTLKLTSKGSFYITAIVGFMVVLVTRIIFSGIVIVDYTDGILFNNIFYNWFNSFIGTETIVIILYLTILANRRLK
jgi:hypothetical protein